MALKKKVPATATKPATSSVTSEAKRRAIAPPTRKAVPKPAPRKASPNVDMRKPIEPPKEVKKDEPKTKVQPPIKGKERKSPEAKEPAVTSGGTSAPAQPRRASEAEKRVSVEAMRAMTLEDRYALFKKLNTNPERFVPIRSELPKKDYIRKDEAILREIIGPKPPKVKSATVYYCCYCVDWQVFHSHSFTGYNKCTGCGMTTKDMYIGIDNGVFGKE